jgi:hypothetical protein
MWKAKLSDPWSDLVIVLTLGIFILAPFLKGFTHELLLEAAVFLVSVELIIMASKNTKTASRVEQHLNRGTARTQGLWERHRTSCISLMHGIPMLRRRR